ncbi:Uncharacterized protein conserved in bacteria (DUF2125) [Bartonella vinsonii]|uniref:Uncharacterized protein conserved in bacteria (DUF2125) n=1 Tax=Bartonella vinsonii TaxID=33047 RepID=A0A448V470_BARVI|nr:Uncharacterized protein conserved in bacteria (DUF2125) [Bartonella vinsonii]
MRALLSYSGTYLQLTLVFFSRKIEDHISNLFAKASAHDMTLVCEHLDKNGYPLRIGVVCDQFQFVWPLHGISLSTERLTVGAPIYAPHFVEFNVHSPTSIVFSGKTPIASHWRNLVIETEPYWRTGKTFKLMVEGLEISTIASFKEQKPQGKLEPQTKNKKTMQEKVGEQTSLTDVQDVIVPLLNQENVPQKITAEFLRLDLKHEKNHLSGHITFDDFDSSMFFAPYFIDFPKIDGNLKWVFNDVTHLFENGENSWKQRLYGKSGVLKRSELIFHTGGVLRVSGPFSFDDEGYLTANFELVFVKHMELLTTMQRLFPEQANNLQALFFVLGVMPKSPDGYPVLPLQINHGWAKLGFLKLGRLVPL